ncbi:MAG: pyruvate kinase [Gammaproteobacteria bacterium]
MPIITQVDLLKKRRTKIVATVGPASCDPETIRELIMAGVNVFRLNMSHGDHDSHRAVFSHIRNISTGLDEPVAVLADLCGPKIRTGRFIEGEIMLERETQVVVTTRDIPGEAGLIPSQYRSLADDVKHGDRILLNDGIMELRVEAVKGTEITCRVLHGGVLRDHKGINLPGVRVSAPSLTDKDREDARFALDLGVDYLALSFVRQAADIKQLQGLIQEAGGKAAIIAKIEKTEALQQANAILQAADGIMVARGDLGVELQPEEVPIAQSQLITRARQKFKPVIVATQMLESMIENSRPTRAEVTDISHAVSQGTDAVMLSAETATGAFPVEAVKIMDRIVRQTEAHLWKSNAYAAELQPQQQTPTPIWDATANAVNKMAYDLGVKAVMVMSHSGMSAATMVSARPAAPVVAITSDAGVCRRMALLWSVIPIHSEKAGSINPNQLARQVAKDLGLAGDGEYILLVRGFHRDIKMNSPTITALTVH